MSTLRRNYRADISKRIMSGMVAVGTGGAHMVKGYGEGLVMVFGHDKESLEYVVSNFFAMACRNSAITFKILLNCLRTESAARRSGIHIYDVENDLDIILDAYELVLMIKEVA